MKTNNNQRPDAATGTTTAEKIKALKVELMKKKNETCPFLAVGLIVYPFDPYYGLSAIDANEVCKEVLGRGKYELYEVAGKFAGALIKF